MCTSDILCVTNRRLCREDFLQRIGRIAACRPAGIILREKDLPQAEYTALARQVAAVCERHGVPCIVHGSASAALALQAEALHLPLHALRQMTQLEKAQFRSIGASCHSAAEAQEAERLGCTYLSAGHVFDTDCKQGLPGRGVAFLQQVCAAVSIPVYAIGGVSPDNIAQVRGAGARGACLMSSLMTCPDPAKLLRAMEEEK